MSIIENLLKEEPYLTKLKDYEYVNTNDLDIQVGPPRLAGH